MSDLLLFLAVTKRRHMAGKVYSPECVEGEFSEVGLSGCQAPLNSAASFRKSTSSSRHVLRLRTVIVDGVLLYLSPLYLGQPVPTYLSDSSSAWVASLDSLIAPTAGSLGL